MEINEVQVYKVPNGHILKVNGNEFMYYTIERLKEGFMYHVGLEEPAPIDSETMRDFLTAAIVWKEQGETVKELVKVKKENDALISMVENMKKQIKRLNDRMRGNADDNEDAE